MDYSILLNNKPVFTGLCFILGLCVGSFLNVVIYRLPKLLEHGWQLQCAELRGETLSNGESFNLVTPNSHCPHCGHYITLLENIPVLSYLLLKGLCSQCHTAISWRYPLIEALTGLSSAYLAWHFGFGGQAFAALLFVWAMIALTFIDLDTFLLPDNITLPLVWAGLIFNMFNYFTDLKSAVIGAAAGYLILWSIYWLFKLLVKKEGMGYGDFKLLAAIGAWFGWQMLPVVVLLSSIVGAVVGIGMILFFKRHKDHPIPFGPYLAAAGVIALLWGNDLTRYYLQNFI
jgi:leader peptidase (prepilin peptidase)/N-methyltransferase